MQFPRSTCQAAAEPSCRVRPDTTLASDATLAPDVTQVETMPIDPAVISEVIPVFYSRDASPFPGISVEGSAGRPPSLAALTYLAARPRAEWRMFVAVQRDPTTSKPTLVDLHTVGIIVKVTRITPRTHDDIEYEMTGVERARLIAIDTKQSWHAASIQRVESTGTLTQTRAQELSTSLAHDELSVEAQRPRPRGMSDSDFLDLVVDRIPFHYLDLEDRDALLQEIDVDRRAARIVEIIDAALARLRRLR